MARRLLTFTPRPVIIGAHTIRYSHDADVLRAFFRDVLGWHSVDAGRGWLIFAMPPGEIAVHPLDGDTGPARTELYLMCDDLDATILDLAAKGVTLASPVADQPWGRRTSIALPDGSALGLYQPRHPLAISR